MTDRFRIRPEAADDAGALDALLRRSFGGADEAQLVRALRRDGDLAASLVADDAGGIVGHAALSPLPLRFPDGSPVTAFALAPVAVIPQRQRQGIGTALVEALIGSADRPLVVLGQPEYYRRFGFSSQLAAQAMRCPFEGAGEAFMAYDPDGRLAGRRGGCPIYAEAFGLSAPPAAAG